MCDPEKVQDRTDGPGWEPRQKTSHPTGFGAPTDNCCQSAVVYGVVLGVPRVPHGHGILVAN